MGAGVVVIACCAWCICYYMYCMDRDSGYQNDLQKVNNDFSPAVQMTKDGFSRPVSTLI